MNLFLKLPSGHIVSLDVPATDTIYGLKLRIQRKLGISPSQQHLVYTENLCDLDLIALNPDAFFEARKESSTSHLADRHLEELLVCASEQLLNGRLLSDYNIQNASTLRMLFPTKSKSRQL